MLIAQITGGCTTLNNVAGHIVKLHHKPCLSRKEWLWLYRMAENEDLRFLLTRYWQVNKNERGIFDGGEALFTAHLFKSVLDILEYWRTRRKLRQQTARNYKSTSL